MFDYLGQHPAIGTCKKKEPQFFGTDIKERTKKDRHLDLNTYLQLFDHIENDWAMEAYTWNLFSKTAAKEIHEFNSDGRIIIMLRDPAEMAYSLYFQNRYNDTEELETFEAALGAEKGRKNGTVLAPRANPIDHLLYSEVICFHDQVKRYLDLFGPEQVRIILFNDFKLITLMEVQKIFTWLGIDDKFQPDLEIVNQAKVNKNKGLRRFYDNPPSILRKVARLFLSSKQRSSMYKKAVKSNAKKLEKPVLDPETRKRLIANTLDDIEKLEALIGRDLSHWKRTN